MALLMEHVQPFTEWLKAHSDYSLLLTFIISFGESLAIIGSIVPGSVMMTMVGILAGTGVIRIDLTLIAAILGAIAGDGGSYLLGYYCSDKLLYIWPFKKHPQWLEYGKAYFIRHGGKSVFFGRFIGPLRSVIPVIAGMMQMKKLEFLLANAISAIAWSIVYIGPGILIGAASSGLSAESATRLFFIVLAMLLGLWLVSLGLHWLWKRVSLYLYHELHQIWCAVRAITSLRPIVRLITPPNEANHAGTCSFVFLFFIFCAFSIALLHWIMNETTLELIDMPVYFFLQSFRTHAFDLFFTIITLLINPYPIIIMILTILGFSIFLYDWRLLRYWRATGCR
jgi:membrane protein DedA with SNARE-associated domain